MLRKLRILYLMNRMHENITNNNNNNNNNNRAFESVELFKYLGITQTYQKYIHEQIKSRLGSENAYYHLVQNLLSYSWLSKSIRIKIYKTTVLPVVLNWFVKLGLSQNEAE
jgi:hypothetical protein